MQVRRPSWITLTSLIAIVLLPATTNIAASALPQSWQSYLWLAWPLSLFLAGPVVLTEIRRRTHQTKSEHQGVPQLALERSIWNIPAPIASYSNRESSFLEVGTLLTRGSGQSIVIYGMGGVGKTQFALEYARRVRERERGRLGWLIPAADRVSAVSALADLAEALGLNELNQKAAANAAVAYLSKTSGWLLIFDDARQLRDLLHLIPTPNDGSVIITSRNPDFDHNANSLLLEPFSQHHAREFLLVRSRDSDVSSAEQIARELGNLPLALEQAATYCREVGISLADYVARYNAYQLRLLRETVAAADQLNVNTVVGIAIRQASKKAPGTLFLLGVLSMLAAEDIPRGLLSVVPGKSNKLHPVFSSAITIDRAVRALRQSSLLTSATTNRIRIHEVVAKVARESITSERQSSTATGLLSRAWRKPRYEKVVNASLVLLDEYLPADDRDPRSWTKAAAIFPHLKAITGRLDTMSRQSGVDMRRLTRITSRTALHIFHKGEFRHAEALSRQALRFCDRHFKNNDSLAQDVMFGLLRILHWNGKLDEAQQLAQTLLPIRATAYGPSHHLTITVMNSLAGVLIDKSDQLCRARILLEEVTSVSTRLYGADHTLTLFAQNNYAKCLRLCGEMDTALAISSGVLETGRRIFGDNHPDVLIWMYNLAEAFLALGDLTASHDLHNQTLGGRLAVLGKRHPLTIVSKTSMANVSARLGDIERAGEFIDEAVNDALVVLDSAHPWTVQALQCQRKLNHLRSTK